ncbi:hypothetical protein DY000_02047548 [Brassica cretica]|uniref:Uncharacterized protein n=1 Tax=Brassica cretica TaxID=69181 RepID=A0ABQ7F8C6_BRACR|nr:hypothetical protein DY000_02047548 [Brassica cretica]
MGHLTLEGDKLRNVSWNSPSGRESRRIFAGSRKNPRTCTGGIAHLDITILLDIAGRRYLGGEKFLRENAKGA